MTISNGLAWTPDGGTLYYIDTPLRRVDAFDYDLATGRLSNRRPHIALPDDEPGDPDGMTMDTEGGLWVALWNGYKVVPLRARRQLDVVVEMPASHVTSVMFGGPDLEDLYITCAWSELTDEERAAEPMPAACSRCGRASAAIPRSSSPARPVR